MHFSSLKWCKGLGFSYATLFSIPPPQVFYSIIMQYRLIALCPETFVSYALICPCGDNALLPKSYLRALRKNHFYLHSLIQCKAMSQSLSFPSPSFLFSNLIFLVSYSLSRPTRLWHCHSPQRAL